MFGKNNKRDNYYFDGFVAQAQFSAELCKKTKELMEDFKYDEVKDNIIELHGIEHAADQKQHEIIERLSREFIAPLEREDIDLMAKSLDDLVDAIEDIMITIYEYDVREIDETMLKYMEIIQKGIDSLLVLLGKLENFKKDNTLTDQIIEINNFEEIGDRIYRESMHKLFSSESDPKTLISKKEIYICLEDVMDDIEDLSNLVESIVMKNS